MENCSATSVQGITSNLEVATNTNGSVLTAEKIPFIVVGTVLSVVSFYVLIATIVHRLRRRNVARKAKESTKSKRNNRTSGRRKSSTSPWLDNLTAAAVTFTFLNCISDHPIVYTVHTSDMICRIMQVLSFLFYTCGTMCLYSFLWLRQRACYRDPTLAQTHNKLCRVASGIILPIFLGMRIIGMILTGVTWSFKSSPEGCIEVTGTRTPQVLLFVSSLAMQCTLLGLFIHPLRRHTDILFGKSPERSTDTLLGSLVKRSIIITGFCVLADFVAFVLSVSLDHNLPIIVNNYIYDANVLWNVICIIGSFGDWQKRLLPCYKTNNIRKPVFLSSKYSSSVKNTCSNV